MLLVKGQPSVAMCNTSVNDLTKILDTLIQNEIFFWNNEEMFLNFVKPQLNND